MSIIAVAGTGRMGAHHYPEAAAAIAGRTTMVVYNVGGVWNALLHQGKEKAALLIATLRGGLTLFITFFKSGLSPTDQ